MKNITAVYRETSWLMYSWCTSSPRPPPQKAPALFGNSMVRLLVDSLTKHGSEML